MKNIFHTLLILFSVQVIAQQKSVLFLGNSYTATSNLPATLYNLAAAGGDTIVHDKNTPGGYTLEGHSTNSTSLNKITSREWDFVVLQEQSQKPSFPPGQVASETFPYAEILVDSIKSNYECSEPVFFMTWGRRDGDQQNCQFYSPLCTFEGMNARLRESYLEMGSYNEATVAPCGAAWKQLAESDNTSWSSLYSGDGSHPSSKGTYLNACIFYATIFRQSPVGIPYYSNLFQQDAEMLQQIAEDIVIDSLDNWYIGHQDVVGNANYSLAGGLIVNFSNQSENATDHEWSFGDGSFSDETDPQHIYPTSGAYTVSYIASSNCDSDTTYLELVLNPFSTSVSENFLNQIELKTENHFLKVKNDLQTRIKVLVYDSLGKLAFTEELIGNSTKRLNLHALNGTFIVAVDDGENRLSRRFVHMR